MTSSLELIRQIYYRQLGESEFIELALSNPKGIYSFFNDVALDIAHAYNNNDLEYEQCHFVASWLFSAMVNEIVLAIDGYKVPSPAYDVFLAFDAGEYTHPGDHELTDSVQKYTNKMLKDILYDSNRN